MASYRQLDSPRCPAVRRAVVFLSAFLATSSFLVAQSMASADAPQIQRLFHQERWQEIANLHPPLNQSADVDFAYGIALARLERWEEAAAAFRSGLKLKPHEARFMVELAGVDFKQKKYAEAQDWLERALHVSSHDEYQLDFLATVFYLEGNLEAALKYWNQVGKPRIETVSLEPVPRLKPVLLDRAFVFSPASTLKRAELRTTEAQIRQLDVFSAFKFDLQPQPEGHFDLVFNNAERNGCGNKWECLLSVLGQSPAQTLNFDYFNIARDAINFRSSFRFDSEKRRLVAAVEMPVLRPKWHLRVGADLRNENWVIQPSFSGNVPRLAALNLQRHSISAEFTDVMSGRWQWSTSTEFAERSYRNVITGSSLTEPLLTPGPELKQSFAIQGHLIRVPERRFSLDGGSSIDVARLWGTSSSSGSLSGSSSSRNFARFDESLHWSWYPQHSGEKYLIQHAVRAGRSAGQVPFDELSVLGILGDADLPMKAHIATRDGRKGSAPLGSNYFVSNWEATRQFSPKLKSPIMLPMQVAVGPFLDTGKISDPGSALGSGKWLWDVGLEAKVRVFQFEVMLSYGRDLRSGRNAVVTSSPLYTMSPTR